MLADFLIGKITVKSPWRSHLDYGSEGTTPWLEHRGWNTAVESVEMVDTEVACH